MTDALEGPLTAFDAYRQQLKTHFFNFSVDELAHICPHLSTHTIKEVLSTARNKTIRLTTLAC